MGPENVFLYATTTRTLKNIIFYNPQKNKDVLGFQTSCATPQIHKIFGKKGPQSNLVGDVIPSICLSS
jgi:hypothetical protein